MARHRVARLPWGLRAGELDPALAGHSRPAGIGAAGRPEDGEGHCVVQENTESMMKANAIRTVSRSKSNAIRSFMSWCMRLGMADEDCRRLGKKLMAYRDSDMSFIIPEAKRQVLHYWKYHSRSERTNPGLRRGPTELTEVRCGACGRAGTMHVVSSSGDELILQCTACAESYLLDRKNARLFLKMHPGMVLPSSRYNPSGETKPWVMPKEWEREFSRLQQVAQRIVSQVRSAVASETAPRFGGGRQYKHAQAKSYLMEQIVEALEADLDKE